MKTFFGSLYHAVYTSNKIQILWCAALLATVLILMILHHRWRDDTYMLKRWRLCCLIPLAIIAVHYVIYLANFMMAASAFTPMYLIALLLLLPMLFAKRRIGYRITASVSCILSVLCGTYFCFTAPNVHNYSRKSYTDSFRALVRTMDKEYVLKEWKEIDFSALEAKYMPMIEEAEKEGDAAKFADAVSMFCHEIHDGHVAVQIAPNVKDIPFPFQIHEYGMSMMRLDNGDVIAVCVDPKLNRLGIEDGTVITKWNGTPVLRAAADDIFDMGRPVKENTDRLALLYLAGTGSDTAEVSYIDAYGAEQTVQLSEQYSFHTYHDAFTAFANIDDEADSTKDNFSTKMLNDKCGYLMLLAEGTDNGMQDNFGYLMGDHKWVREMFREKLRELKAQGMEYLVIDLRNNTGGIDEIGLALCDLLTDEQWYGQGLGIRKNGEYTCVSDHFIHGDGEFADLKVVALTNFNCASAGDGAALYLSRLPNVTLAGMTDPDGCNQETGGMCMLSDGVACVVFPTGLVLNEDGVPNIDTRADRISRNPVDVRIPLDYDAAMRIFHYGEDYELEWAIEYLQSQSLGT